jgi:hypothetical protein
VEAEKVEENRVRRTKPNVFENVFHQMFGVATDDELLNQLRMTEELRGSVSKGLLLGSLA